MNYKKWLIYRIFDLLALIETPENQPIIRQIQGLLYNLMDD
jgi:hypothetical protein|nr:MAG TPA: hypothetical protein [Caudoviricetes sp.]